VNDASAYVFGLPAVAGFNALACVSAVAGVPTELKSLLLLLLPTVAEVSWCCWRFLVLLAFPFVAGASCCFGVSCCCWHFLLLLLAFLAVAGVLC